MRIGAVIWGSQAACLKRVALECGVDLLVLPYQRLQVSDEHLEEVVAPLKGCDVLVVNAGGKGNWAGLARLVERENFVRLRIFLNGGPCDVSPYVATRLSSYLENGGPSNMRLLLESLRRVLENPQAKLPPPHRLPKNGIYHPKAPDHFETLDDYLNWYEHASRPLVGILFSRSYWVSGETGPESCLIGLLERRGVGVVAVFSESSSAVRAAKRFFLRGTESVVRFVVKLLSFPAGGSVRKAVSFFKRLGTPVLGPVVSYRKTEEEWWEDDEGISGEATWLLVLPEMEGAVEPIILGVLSEDGVGRVAIPERCERAAERIISWLRLKDKPVSERRIAVVLHNSPCAAAEASIGGAAHLDAPESVVRILRRLKQEGYRVDPPDSGEMLVQEILRRRAVSEFRWTSIDQIIKGGGAVYLMDVEEYLARFNRLPAKLRDRVRSVWGEPPGETRNGVPAAMVYNGKIVITGVVLENVIVLVQPKRGCAGPQCDGRVCKILHDPTIPPPHQYFATYWFLTEKFGADCVIHIGTHGNLEFLPGKSVGLSSACSPDAAINTVPHLYIYNSDNGPEATIAKRRSYAVLIGHMQVAMKRSGTYGVLSELEEALRTYLRLREENPSQAHAALHEALRSAKRGGFSELVDSLEPEEAVSRLHELITQIRDMSIQDGMHIFGERPKGVSRLGLISAMLCGMGLLSALARSVGVDLDVALRKPDARGPDGLLYSEWLARVEKAVDAFTAAALRYDDPIVAVEDVLGCGVDNPQQLLEFARHARSINRRISQSNEMGGLLNAISVRYIPAGPTGCLSRGRAEVLPTGRNLYLVDVTRLPTRAAWEVGKKLAERLIEGHRKSCGSPPRRVAIHWMANDLMWADGEVLAQIMALVGVEPVWSANGKVETFKVVTPDELGRPRVDVVVRVSGITRDNFRDRVEYLDRVLREVSSLEEPSELNPLAAYTRGRATEDPAARIFCSAPSTYGSGTQLAVFASAWKERKDLAEVFMAHNCWSYGVGRYGKRVPHQLASLLSETDAVFNRAVTDEYDLFGCCCYFGTYGGLFAAAEELSGRPPATYYGDTRRSEAPLVRSLADEIRRVARGRILNPRWIEAMRRHGYKAAGDFTKRIQHIFGWAATTSQVDQSIFTDIAKRYVLDEEMRRWFMEHNIFALEEITRRLLEAATRKIWKPDKKMLHDIRRVYSQIEGFLEEQTAGPVQGGSVDVITAVEVDDWKAQLQDVREAMRRFGGRK